MRLIRTAQSKMSFRMVAENTCRIGESEGPFAPEFHFRNNVFRFMVSVHKRESTGPPGNYHSLFEATCAQHDAWIETSTDSARNKVLAPV